MNIIFFKNLVIGVSLMSIISDLNAVKPKTAQEIAKQEAQIKASQAIAKMPLKMVSALKIIQQLRSGQMKVSDLKRLPGEMQEYLQNLSNVLFEYENDTGNKNIYENPKVALRISIEKGAVDIVEYLLEIGAPVNEFLTDRSNTTFLVYSVDKYHTNTNIIRLLIKYGAEVNRILPTPGAPTALFWAILDLNLPAIITLIEHGADLAIINNDNETILHRAVGFDTKDRQELSAQVIKFLLENNATRFINHRDNRGRTALMHAIFYNNFPAVKILLENGADINITNNQNHTAIDIARNPMMTLWGNPESKKAIINLLEEYQTKQQKK